MKAFSSWIEVVDSHILYFCPLFRLCTWRDEIPVVALEDPPSALLAVALPGRSRSSAYHERLWLFRHEVSSYKDFVTLFEQAKDGMSLLFVGGNAFSKDILRGEISGYKQPKLTIVDRLGLIHVEKSNVEVLILFQSSKVISK